MIYIYKNLLWFFKQEWFRYVKMVILLLLLAYLQTVPGKILGTSIDLISTEAITYKLLLLLGGLLALIPIVRYGLNYWYHNLINKGGFLLTYLLRKKYLNHIFTLDNANFEKYSKGDLIARVTNDMQSISNAATFVLQEVVYCSAVLVFVIASMLVIHVKLTLASATIIIVVFAILDKLRRNTRKYYKIHRKIYSTLVETVLESVSGVKVVRAYTQEEQDYKKLENAINDDINSWQKIVKTEAIFGPLFGFTVTMSYFIAMAYGTFLVINQSITAGDLITFNIYLGMLRDPIIGLGNVYQGINQAQIATERINEIMALEPEVKESNESKTITEFNKIEFKDVRFKYPFDERNTIDGVTFTINKGETIGIVGPTGAGKSTLIKQLIRSFNVTDGTIFIDEQPIDTYKIEDVRNLVGYVPQSHILFRQSVEENILIGKQDASNNDFEKALKIADFKKDLQFLSNGIYTAVGESGVSLSGGQKQRLSIARAAVKNPELLILDDSLSAVDANTEKNIIEGLKQNRADKTNIIIAHRFSAIVDADKILVIQNGKIVQCGTHKQLLEQHGWYKDQYEKQVTMV